MEVGFLVHILGAHGIIHRTHGFAFTEDIQCDALPDIALRAAVGKEAGFPAHHVDEARRNHLAVDVDVGPPARALEVADLGDGVAIDGDSARDARRARAIANHAVAKDDVVLRSARAGAEEKRRADDHHGFRECTRNFQFGFHDARI